MTKPTLSCGTSQCILECETSERRKCEREKREDPPHDDLVVRRQDFVYLTMQREKV
jgi:hypothetical protein